MANMEWPWQYGFPPFFTLQPHSDTRAKQIAAWRSLVLEYHRLNKLGVLDVREAERSPLFYNATIDRKLPMEGIVVVLEDLLRTKNAEPLDKAKHRWHIYYHTLEEWANLIYTWIQNNGMTNTVCTLYELIEGDNTTDEEFHDLENYILLCVVSVLEFHGLDNDILIKALRILEGSKRAEIIMFDDNQGVKFF